MNVYFHPIHPAIRYTGKKKDGRDLFSLEESIDCKFCHYDIVIPKGFITDGASVPPGFWNIFPPLKNEYFVATLLHDWLYNTEYFERKYCDMIFLEGLKSLGVNIAKRNLMYYAVRMFGCNGWNRHTLGSVMTYRILVGIESKKRPLIKFQES